MTSNLLTWIIILFIFIPETITIKMRQLKGGKSKETRKEKQRKKQENAIVAMQIKRVVLPTLAIVCLTILFYVFIKTRPIATLEE